jgi:hypothetical protein
VTVHNVAPSPEITGLPANSPEETQLTLGCIPHDPGTLDTLTYAWHVSGGGETFDGSGPSFSFTPNNYDTYTVSVTVTDDDGGVGTDTRTVDITWVTFRVQDFTPTASGCDMRLIRPLDTSVLNLYDGEKPNGSPGDYGTPDLTVVGSTVGQVVGSLVWDAAARTARFVKTGGLLAPDTYTVTLASRSDGWKDLRGETLDGNADGVEALTGDDYVTTFTVSEAAGAMVGLPDFARGPGQTVNVPATGTGLPIRITGGTGATSVSLELA